MVLVKKLQLENKCLNCSQRFHNVVLCYTLYGSIALQLQNKTRVEPVKGDFMRRAVSALVIQREKERCVGRLIYWL